ncbi:NAD(P)H-binding protein [Streptomyces lasalocidi]
MGAGPILVTGVGGTVGGVGDLVLDHVRANGVPARALVHHDDERAAALRALDGVEVVVGDLTRGADVVDALSGCRRAYFGMSVSPRTWRPPRRSRRPSRRVTASICW